jgi:hypothetical protein
MHNSRTQFEIIMRFDTLFCNRLRYTLAVPAFELTGEQVAQPSFQKRDYTAHEEEPHAPAWCPETVTRTFTNGAGIEAVVNQMLQVLGHSHLSHQLIGNKVRMLSQCQFLRITNLVLVTVHSCQGANMREDVLKCVGQLESVDVTQAELNMCVHDELGETKNFSAQMERISEAGFLALLGSQGPGKKS